MQNRGMRKSVVAILMVAATLPVCAQEFNAHWIYAPQADSLSHVWFRRAYLADGRPRRASVTVASTGFFKLYVNECNVGTALFYPVRRNGDDSPIAMTFDVTPYLRRDTNVVAVAYSPNVTATSHKQISVGFYGIDHKGRRFSHASDNSWICRRANSRKTSDGGEEIDGRGHDPTWKAATCTSAALWLGAEEYKAGKAQTIGTISESRAAWQTSRVTSLSYLHISQNPVMLRLANSFWGFVRLTLRDARRGERLQIGNLRYTCSGTMDEQAFPLFTLGGFSAVSVSGDNRFKPSQITDIDLVETQEKWFNEY